MFQVACIPDPNSLTFIVPSLFRIHNFASLMFPFSDICYSVTVSTFFTPFPFPAFGSFTISFSGVVSGVSSVLLSCVSGVVSSGVASVVTLSAKYSGNSTEKSKSGI